MALNDIIIGDSEAGNGAGTINIIFGSTTLITSPIFSEVTGTIPRSASSFGSKLGDIITPVGDLNGDGINEFMVHSN